MICWIQSANKYVFSIRASLQQRGEPFPAAATRAPMLAAWPFQSAPHFSSEANQFWGYYRCELWFVSIRASLQQRGEPEIRASVILRARVSIRASLQQRGELKCLRSSRRNSFVSIRASLQQRGEHSIGGGVDINISSFNPRLTSAARRTAFSISPPLNRRVSIRASLQQRGEPISLDVALLLITRFNPRLTSAARRTQRGFALDGGGN